ncbi:glycosyltransferase [Pedobacter alpinus]|uniref:Glycosyltransferase n=1 Tax=Pedobacter alpinus TaxID=1590643 RepID=A0ABW5TSV4_9SPHI
MTTNTLPEILVLTTFPPRECGIATYSQDLVKALNNKFEKSFRLQICALESDHEKHSYSDEVKYTLNTDKAEAYGKLAKEIQQNDAVKIVLIQHEFGLFEKTESNFIAFLEAVKKPIILVFHTVLPQPNASFKLRVKQLASASQSIVVMTNTSASILIKDYGIPKNKINVIAHGTHLVPHSKKQSLKENYKYSGKMVLSTFGLLSSGKNIETTLKALPQIIKKYPNVLFLIIGKTHPLVKKVEGEKYRNSLETIVDELKLKNHVEFINYFLPLPILLEYLQLTDVYLFTSKDPNQAVSGTFSYAISCGCPVVSTPIPHAIEVLEDDAGIIIEFENADMLSNAVISLLDDENLRLEIGSKGLHLMASTAWENSAIAHALLFEQIENGKLSLHYKIPDINLDHIQKLTTPFGMIQFSKINQPDIKTGYTLDDNARAMVAMCQHFELSHDEADLKYIRIYFNFIKYCQQAEGDFLNYIDEETKFTSQNEEVNLEDSNGRAIWALGHLISIGDLLPEDLRKDADMVLQKSMSGVNKIHSTRAMAFIIKGLYYAYGKNQLALHIYVIKEFADRLVQMYRHEDKENWHWYERYLTYGNSIIPEAMLCAWLVVGDPVYKNIAKKSFDFLISKTFTKSRIKVISNQGWLYKDSSQINRKVGGEQPIDIAYTIMALKKFYQEFNDEDYRKKITLSFDWFLGNNHLNQIIYNPCTGGCYDGLEEHNVNLNQGAESTVSYLMARLTLEKLRLAEKKVRLFDHQEFGLSDKDVIETYNESLYSI